MKKIINQIVVLLCMCLISSFTFGCKSTEDYIKECKYQDAYDNCKNAEEKDLILLENEVAVILNNCYKLKNEIREDVVITDIKKVTDYSTYLKNRNIKYVLAVRKKKILDDGYYQPHYYTFTNSGSLYLDIYANDITEILDCLKQGSSVSDKMNGVLDMDVKFGTSYYSKYVQNQIDRYFFSDEEIEEMDTNAGFLSELDTFDGFNLCFGKGFEEKIINNLNNLVLSGKISNVEKIKK